MKPLVAACAIVLLVSSTAMGGWVYVAPVPVVVPAPAPVVHYYWPVGPVYAYPPPVLAAPPVVVAPGPVVYGPRVVVRAKVYPFGQPVRNVVRAVLP